MVKWIVRIFVLMVIAFFLTGVFAYFNLKAKQPPDNARFGIQDYDEDKNGLVLPTRIYYAEKLKIVDGCAELYNYWTYDGEKYRYNKGNKTVEPPFKIVERGTK